MSKPVDFRLANVDDAPAMLRTIRAAFSARPPVDPPAAALSDTEDDIRAALSQGEGVCAEHDGQLVGCLLLGFDDDVATLSRVSVLPAFSSAGLGGDMVSAAAGYAAERGCRTLELMTRVEFPEITARWVRKGFEVDRAVKHGLILARTLPLAIVVPSAEAMLDLGRRLADLLRPGDVLIADGELGAGKTTLAQGIGAGLQVAGPIVSPTFVLSRVHPSLGEGPAFVHVDAYRLGDAAELDDIDLASGLSDSVTLVEWGRNKAEHLSPERLEIEIVRSLDPQDETRTVYLLGVGQRWEHALEQLRSRT